MLVGCEHSGVVRDAFLSLGHTAYSNDILPCDADSTNHIQGDVFEAIKSATWDLIILHPPCTYITRSGIHWNKKQPERALKTEETIEWTIELWNAAVKAAPRVALENPIGVLSTRWMKPTQIIQPWMFGHPEQKATCLWEYNLPKLQETKNVKAEMLKLPLKERTRVHYMAPGPDRWKKRSITLQGPAQAMAKQWGGKIGI